MSWSVLERRSSPDCWRSPPCPRRRAAQAGSTAQISGTVTDSSGGVLPGVDVTVTQTDTGLMRSAVTDATGGYTLPNLPVGPYRLEAALSGFRTYVQTGIVLTVNATPAVNVVMSLGELSEQVTVTANAAMVETRSTGVGQLIDNQRVLELPLNGRQVTDLLLLSPGVTIKRQAGLPRAATIPRCRSRSPAAHPAARSTSWTAPTTTTPAPTSICRCRSPTRSRNSRSRRARSPRATATTPPPSSTS